MARELIVSEPEESAGQGRVLVWLTILFPGVPGVTGALKGSQRLHCTREEACREGEGWVDCPVEWSHLDETISVGHIDRKTLLVRGILLPRGVTLENSLSPMDNL